jgi:hypothetical protein
MAKLNDARHDTLSTVGSCARVKQQVLPGACWHVGCGLNIKQE